MTVTILLVNLNIHSSISLIANKRASCYGLKVELISFLLTSLYILFNKNVVIVIHIREMLNTSSKPNIGTSEYLKVPELNFISKTT